VRLKLRKRGFHPIPVIGKAPPMEKWQKRSETSEGDIEMWDKLFPQASNTGVLTAFTPCLDIDVLDPAAADAAEQVARERFEEHGDIHVRFGRSPKRALFFRTEEPFKKITINLIAPNGDKEQKIELLASGQQVVVDGIHPGTGNPYAWFGGSLCEAERESLPYIREAEAQELVEAVVEVLAEHGYQRAAPRPKTMGNGQVPKPGGAADWQYLFDNIRDGRELHDTLRDLAAKMIASRMAAGAAVNQLRALMKASTAPHDARWQERYDDIPRAVETAEQKYRDGVPSDNDDKGKKPAPISARPFILRDPGLIPRRDWIYGNHLIRKFGSATIAAGGTGKTNLLIVEALAIVTGRPLLGIRPRMKGKVWLWNGEDPYEEIERRVVAACLHYQITPLQIEGGLFINSGRDNEIVIATQTRDGIRIATPMVEALHETIIDNKIDVVQIDPFISSHRVTENDNNAIDLVAKTWTRLADITDSAIDLAHHIRKTGGAEATVEDGRGASALLNASRSSRVLNTMSEEEADKAGVTARRAFFKVGDGRINLAPPSDTADWYFMKSVNLGNGPPNDPLSGDNVGVVTRWAWPDPLDGVTGKDFEKVAAAIRGGKWRENVQAKDWVGHAVAKALGLDVNDRADKAKIIGLLKVWLGPTGGLRVVDGEDEKRNLRKFVEVREEI
jgi:AAA domain/Bifunctional DNA primase/polymerase, N-terminal